ncbi:Type-1 restriction enzyme EcoKI specificity protein [Gammaproteobacteria bacterium]|nr:Type-1 restriction enzyme EcoKI specificity protein [Gammaproteobacteria bacterium]
MASSAYQAELEAICPEDWKVVPLTDAAFFQEGPGILAKDFHDSGVPLIRLKGVEGDFVTLEGCNFLAPEKVANKWNHFRLERGDLVISTSASFGRVSVVTEEAEGAVPYTGLIRFRPKNKDIDSGFLRAFLGSSAFMQQVEAMASGSVIRHFGPMHLKQMALPLPPIDEQHAIGEMATLLADRINNLRQSNATLEAIAAGLFKSRFVDFDGMPPEDMQESELGLIPKGWRVASLDAIADYLNGLALQKFPPESDTEFLPVIKIAQLRAGNISGADKASTKLKPEYIVEDGDVLFSWSGSLEVEVWTGGRGALNQHLFKVTSREVPKWFYYFATRQHLSDFRAIAAGKATTMGHIQRRHLTAAKVVVPPPEQMTKHDVVIAPLFEQKINNALRIRTLANLRDALLPRLLSGQLRVKQ